MKYIVFLFLLLLISNAYGLEYPRMIEQEGSFIDLEEISLDYLLISDENGTTITEDNFKNKIDGNSFEMYIDEVDFRELGYSYNEDVNELRYKEIVYEEAENKINVQKVYDFVFDIDINGFYIYDDYYFLISDNNFLLYEYEEKEFLLRENVDTNHLVNDIEVIDYNGSVYVFLANEGKGISIYEFFDVNNSFSFVREVVYGNSFLAKKLLSFELEGEEFVFSVQETYIDGIGFLKTAVVYSVEGLLVGGDAEDNSSISYTEYIHNITFLENEVVFFYFDNKFCIYKYIYNEGIERDFYVCRTNTRLFPIGDQNNLFLVDDSNHTSISVYDPNTNLDVNISSIDTNKTIYNLNLINKITDNNTTIYTIQALNQNTITTIDYNSTSQTFNIKNIQNYSLNLDTNNLKYQSEYNNQTNTQYVGQKNKITKINHIQNYLLRYYIPYPLNNFNLDITNIDYNLYNSFTGDINTTFNITNDYIKDINSEEKHKFNMYLKNKETQQTITIDTNISITENICVLDNKQSNCSFIFNIKQIHDQNNLTYNDYDVLFTIEDLNVHEKQTITFDLTKPTSGGSGGSSSSGRTSSSSSPSSSPAPSSPKPLEETTIDEKQIITNSLELLKKEYEKEKQVFKKYFLESQITNLVFDINYQQDLEKIKENYDQLLEQYNHRKTITTKEYIPTNQKQIENYKTIEDTKKITQIKIQEKKYLFVEIDVNKKTIDFIDKKQIIEYQGDVLFEEDKIIITDNVKYLIEYQNISDQLYREIKPEEKTEIKTSKEIQEKQPSIIFLIIIIFFFSACSFYIYKKTSTQ